MLRFGLSELVLAVFLLASGVLILHFPDALAHWREAGTWCRKRWFPVLAAAAVMVSMAATLT